MITHTYMDMYIFAFTSTMNSHVPVSDFWNSDIWTHVPHIHIVGINNTEEEKMHKTQMNYRHQKLREKLKSGKPRNRTQIHYYQRDYMREEENPHNRSVQ